MGRKKLPDDPRRKQQVQTFMKRHGREKYQEIGSRNGRPTKGSFTSETARAASLKYWADRRAAQAAAESEKTDESNQNES